MELMIISLLLIVVAVLLLVMRKPTPDAYEEISSQQASPPRPQRELSEELDRRITEFLDNDHFLLMIHPVVDFRTGRVCFGEILSRLNHPERGMIFPTEFLPAIDAAELYPRFDRYVFEKTCAWLSSSIAEGGAPEVLSCNFSRKTLSGDDLVADLAAIADRHGLPRNRLAIEITEWDAETDAQQFHRNLHQLKAEGFRIFLDDYGSGVTSVRDLMRYPLDVVKIDRSVLLAADTDHGKAAYRATVSMAAELGAKVVCEGIETAEQNRLAQETGCHYGQGFLFFQPMNPDLYLNMTLAGQTRPEDL